MVQRHPRPAARLPVQRTGLVKDIAVITCHFNWAGFSRPAQNLQRFIRQMARDRVQVYGVEAQLEGRPFVTKGMKGWFHRRAGEEHILFQKEALLNLAAKMLPDRISKVVWLDPDIWFDTSDWLERTSGLLDEAKICQPFGSAWWTNQDGSTALGKPPAALVGIRNSAGHPGFAWAAQRSFFTEAGGLYYKTPVGSGDSILATVLFDQNPTTDGMMFGVGTNHTEYEAWKGSVRDWLGDSQVGFVSGNVWHEWHGERKNRQYITRREILPAFDCQKHLEKDGQGLIRWTADASEDLRASVRDYFIKRREDG